MIPQVQTTVDSYDRIAPYYVKITGMQPETRQSINRWIHCFLYHAPDIDLPILDLGCGGGQDMEVLSSFGVPVVGMDLSPQMLTCARKRLSDGSFIRMDAASWGWKPKTFGGIWASGVLYHLPKHVLHGVLDSIRQSLVPGGVLYFNYLVGSGEGMDQEPGAKRGFPRYYAYYQPQEIVRMLFGFRLLKLEPQLRDDFGVEIDHVLASV
jgi:SAM-dependent methyltransferase